uniref:hypothetical protein n=1 Tax=[Ruminococcus] torques TaxID=33039 RepID=UPI003AEFA85E
MEVVSFLTFLEGKISELLFQIFFLSGIVFLLIFYDVDSSFIILSAVLFLSAQISFLWFSFQKKQKDSQRIINLADELQESYYISDILPKPGDLQNKACKLRSNGMPVPLLRNGYSIFNGTKYR